MNTAMNPVRFSGTNCRLVLDQQKIKPFFHISRQNCYPGAMMLAKSNVCLPDNALLGNVETEMERAKGQVVSQATIKQWMTTAREYLYEYFSDLNTAVSGKSYNVRNSTLRNVPKDYDDKPLEGQAANNYKFWTWESKTALKNDITGLHRINPDTQEHELIFVANPSAELQANADFSHTFTEPVTAAIQDTLQERLDLLDTLQRLAH